MLFDGIAEIWFESREAYEAAVASPAGQAVLADGAVAFDADASWAGFAAEHVMCWDESFDPRTYSATAGNA
jgi:EthD domain